MTRTIDPLRLLALALIGGGTLAWMRAASVEPTEVVASCDADVDAEVCAASSRDTTGLPVDRERPPHLTAAEFCVDVGYLCSGLDGGERVRLRRWVDLEGPLVVHVPRPDLLPTGLARDLQRAAARGVRAWNNEPFPILVDLRGNRRAHASIRWRPSLGGSQLGVTRTRWSPRGGLEVDAIELRTMTLGDRERPAAVSRIRLTAAHEMGHALGLPHSDSPRDVMYPTNTATSMSAQDYRSIDVLYDTPDGTTIAR